MYATELTDSLFELEWRVDRGYTTTEDSQRNKKQQESIGDEAHPCFLALPCLYCVHNSIYPMSAFNTTLGRWIDRIVPFQHDADYGDAKLTIFQSAASSLVHGSTLCQNTASGSSGGHLRTTTLFLLSPCCCCCCWALLSLLTATAFGFFKILPPGPLLPGCC